MLENFENYLLVEKLSINEDAVILSEYIFNIIQNKELKETYIINSNDIILNKIVLDKIILNIKKSNDVITGDFNIQKSKITNRGLFGIINVYGKPNIYTIYHELSHALKFYYKGKTQSLKQLSSLKSFDIKSKNEILKEFLYLFYISEKDELDSYILESFKKLKDILSTVKNINPNKFNLENLFKIFYKDTISYNHYELLKNYNIKEKFKNIKKEDIVSFFDYIEDRNGFYKKYYKKNLINIIRFVLFNIKNYNKLNKIELIDNLDDRYNSIINKYDDRFKKTGNVIHKKLIKLYGLLKEEL